MGDPLNPTGTIITGVIGDDVHNIGIKVIEHALKHDGYKVVSLGIRIPDEEFVEAAVETKADAIFVSSLSGHARALATTLRDKCTEAGLNNILLYIGGHLVIGQIPWEDVEKTFKEMGFDRVYPASTLVASIIKDLKADLEKERGPAVNVSNRRLTDEEFFNERKEVLAMWPTGKDVDLDEAIAYHKSMPRNKNFVSEAEDARKEARYPLVSDMGYTTIEQEIELLRYIQNEGHPDFLGHHVDSLTRNLRFQEAEKQVRKAEATGENLLNGFPVVIHGVQGNRKLTEAVDLPVRLRFVSPTGRLTTEIALAGGNT